MEYRIKNAIIKNVQVSNDNHGCLSLWLELEHDGGCQAFGGYNLYSPQSKKGKDGNKGLNSKNYAGHFIYKVLEIVNVSELSKLKGKSIRIKSTHEHIKSIGHIIENTWFDPSKDFGNDKD
jgi:hypothetical protein